MVDILEALQNAKYNMANAAVPMQAELGKRQLHNAVTLLLKGWALHTEVEPLLERYGDVESVPEAEG